jgi:hypothetical protein
MSACCESGNGTSSTLAGFCGWDVCITTMSDAQLQKCFVDNGEKWMEVDGDVRQGVEAGDSEEIDEEDGEGDDEHCEWSEGDDSSGVENDDGDASNGEEVCDDDMLDRGKRRFRLVRRTNVEFSCAKPSAAVPRFARRAVLATVIATAAVAILAMGV